ncbi:MAG: hypothetical protein IJ343_06280 [Clostridia bacterium]|nr:hypothetical protein [Clostridia bacterium]
MDNFVKLLALLGVAAQAYVLARLPVPKLPGASAAFRQKPGTVSMAVVTAVVALLIQAIVLLAPGDPWVRLIFWAAAMLFTAVSASLSFTAVRYGEEGFVARDALGRRRVVRWEDVLAAEKTQTMGGRPAFRLDATLVYAPGVTLSLIRTMEGCEQEFLDLLHRKRPDLPAGRPDGAAKPDALLAPAVTVMLAVLLLAFVAGGLQTIF